MAKARLRRGIEIVKLANRIKALKMQADEQEDIPGEVDIHTGGPALSKSDADRGLETSTEAGPSVGGKHLSNIAKGAIFREVVLAKVREAKEQEHALQVENDAQDKAAKQNSFQGGQ